MIRIAVVEDESLYADQIMEYLKRYETEEKEGFEITLYQDGIVPVEFSNRTF